MASYAGPWNFKTSPWRVFGGAPRSFWPDIGLLVGFVLLTVLLVWPLPLVDADVAVRDFGQDHQSPIPYWIARGLTYLGQGLPLAIGCGLIAAWVLLQSWSFTPLLMFGSVYIGLAVVLLLKNLLDRVAPRSPDPDSPPYVDAAGALLFGGDGGVSYPSGHMANTAVWYGLAIAFVGVLLPRWLRIVMLTGPPIAVFVSQTYLGFHWLSDQPAGFLLGLLIVRAARRTFGDSGAWWTGRNEVYIKNGKVRERCCRCVCDGDCHAECECNADCTCIGRQYSQDTPSAY